MAETTKSLLIIGDMAQYVEWIREEGKLPSLIRKTLSCQKNADEILSLFSQMGEEGEILRQALEEQGKILAVRYSIGE